MRKPFEAILENGSCGLCQLVYRTLESDSFGKEISPGDEVYYYCEIYGEIRDKYVHLRLIRVYNMKFELRNECVDTSRTG